LSNEENKGIEVPLEEEETTGGSELDRYFDWLKERVKSYGGAIPSTTDTEFYSMVGYLKDNFKISLKQIADMLGIDYDNFRARYYYAKNKVGSGPQAPPQVGTAEVAPALGPNMSNVIINKIRYHLGRSVDRITLDLVNEIVQYGLDFYTKYKSWCDVNGFEGTQCMDVAMNFYQEYSDRVEELEKKIKEYKEFIKMLLGINREKIIELITVEALYRVLEDAVRSGKLPEEDIDRLYNNIYNYVKNNLGVS